MLWFFFVCLFMPFAAEAVADAPDGFDVDGLGGAGLDFFADAVDVDHDGGGVAEGVEAPDALEELVLAEGDAGILHEEEQEVEFAACEADFFAAAEYAARFGLDFELAREDGVMVFGGRGSACQAFVAGDMRLDAGDELVGAEGLDDVVVRTEAEAADLVDFFLSCRNHEDRRVLFPSDGTADGETVETGQHEVEQDEVEVLRESLLRALSAVGDDFGGKPVRFDVVALKLGNGRIVFDDQDAFHGSNLPFGGILRYGRCRRRDAVFFGARQGDL